MNKHFCSRGTAHFLGFAGLIPFVVLSLACWVVHPDWLPRLIAGQLSYGVAILSFLGGLHWGAAVLSTDLSIDRTKIALLWGVTPSLIGVAAAQLLLGLGFLLMMIAFVVAYRVDRRLYQWYQMPEWLLVLRFKLTYVVVASLMLTFIAVNVRS